MEISTKYNVGDEVFVINGAMSKIMEIKIVAVRVEWVSNKANDVTNIIYES